MSEELQPQETLDAQSRYEHILLMGEKKGLTKERTDEIARTFADAAQILDAEYPGAMALVVTDESQKSLMDEAKKRQIRMQKARVQMDKDRKVLKDVPKREIDVIDGSAKMLRDAFKIAEAHLKEQREFAEREEDKRLTKLANERAEKLRAVNFPVNNVGDYKRMSDSQFVAILDSATNAHKTKELEAELARKRQEEEERERKRIEEEKRIAEEKAEKLRKEKEEAEAEAKRKEEEAAEKLRKEKEKNAELKRQEAERKRKEEARLQAIKNGADGEKLDLVLQILAKAETDLSELEFVSPQATKATESAISDIAHWYRNITNTKSDIEAAALEASETTPEINEEDLEEEIDPFAETKSTPDGEVCEDCGQVKDAGKCDCIPF